ncbi:unnamed protein product [Parnassius apollo]|uniref:(apollo) hypothetical protein n=1 Tax=Parnassius apollo TaxID=110799 RepID=A0A8S3XU83_PARAO|nr:unnamed protein product [Parnassius apollo]
MEGLIICSKVSRMNTVDIRVKFTKDPSDIWRLLKSIAQFPETEEKLREEMANASQVGEARSRLAAETAEKAQLITALLPAAQDAAAYDLKEMLNRYKEVMLLNEELLTGCHVRRATQEQAVASLKNLHIILRHAARLRVGKYSKAAVTACRKAVQDNNVEALIKILQIGDC